MLKNGEIDEFELAASVFVDVSFKENYKGQYDKSVVLYFSDNYFDEFITCLDYLRQNPDYKKASVYSKVRMLARCADDLKNSKEQSNSKLR